MARPRRGAVFLNIVLAVVLVAVGAAIFLTLRKGSSSAQAGGVRTAAVARGTVTSSVSASGTVVSTRTLTVGFSDSGKVVSIPVHVGERVRKGTVLSRLLDTARATVRLHSPMRGVVSAIDGAVGQTVGSDGTRVVSGSGAVSSSSGSTSSTGSSSSADASTSSGSGDALVTITQVSGLVVRAYFSEADAVSLRAGQHATVALDALPSRSIAATVEEIDPTATVQSDVVDYGVTLRLRHQPAALRPGQTATVQVVTARAANALYVPTAAVQTAGGQSIVTVLRGGAQSSVPVGVGIQGDQTTQIVRGLSQGELVVIPTSVGANGFPSGGFPRFGAFGGFGGGRAGGAGGGG